MRHGVTVPTENIPVVACAFLAVAEDRVGLGDAHEASRGRCVGGVVVWMVRFGQRVEGALYLGRGGVWGDVESLVVRLGCWAMVVVVGGVIVIVARDGGVQGRSAGFVVVDRILP